MKSDHRHTAEKDLLNALIDGDPLLAPYRTVLKRRLEKIRETRQRLTGGEMSLETFAAGHEYYGLNFRGDGWIFREWAPNATAVFLVSDRTKWRESSSFALERIHSNGDWELKLAADALQHLDLYRLRIHWPGGAGDRIPAYARRVVQDPQTKIFNAQVWRPPAPYLWRHDSQRLEEPPLIYEAHIGMATAAESVGSYGEFQRDILPRIVKAGYNTLQIMALQEHPYYASFGYQVSSFFAASSRFGTPESLKTLVDAAHAAGLCVIMDLIHSHAVSNEVEGLSRFDGTPYQYFHEGPRGDHPAWNSRCFDYGKHQVLHFLLSNCRFWMDEYRVDGFRFDGITSMLYHHHGLGHAFTSYDDYFGDAVDEDALVYLALCNRLIHRLRPAAVTVAEDVSGMPGLAVPEQKGGIGFDYRFAMGVPDYWIRLTKDIRDEDWPMAALWHELTNRRRDEKTISYAESHDQALVGDQTLIFRLIGTAMYDKMNADNPDPGVDRGIALHKMIRLITLATAGHGYLNFMGNEFGHPEWIDFPREGNAWSYKYARRQWHLAGDAGLKYRFLARFDRDMLRLARTRRLLQSEAVHLLKEHNDDKMIAFSRGTLVFIFNFHPQGSFPDYALPAPPGRYRLVLESDASCYGGHDRLKPAREIVFESRRRGRNRDELMVYLPSRTAVVLSRLAGPHLS